MILFCDTSALVKLYVQELDSDAVMQRAAASEILAVSRITWVEVMSAMARRSRERPADAAHLIQARQRFEEDWAHYVVLEITPELTRLAGDYAEAFALRAYDSIQLAAAQTLNQELPGEVGFACFDTRLVNAARLLGMTTA